MLLIKTNNEYINLEHIIKIYAVQATDKMTCFILVADLDTGESSILKKFDSYDSLRLETKRFDNFLCDEEDETKIFDFSDFLFDGGISPYAGTFKESEITE